MIRPWALLLLSIVLMAQVSSLNFVLNSEKKLCMRFEGGKTYTLQYVISGEQDQNVKCTVTQGAKTIISKQGLNDYTVTQEYPGTDPIQICFESDDQDEQEVSFDFFEANDPIRTMIDKKDVELVETVLSQAYKQMEQISRNQEFHIERDQMHKKNLEDSESKIKWAGIVKIVFLLGSALVQLWIMKSFFTSSNPYQPVELQ